MQRFSRCSICIIYLHTVATVAENRPLRTSIGTGEPTKPDAPRPKSDASKTSEVHNMASQLTQKALQAVQETNQQLAPGALDKKSSLEEIAPNAASQTLPMQTPIVALLQAQTKELQKLREAAAEKQHQIDDLQKDVATLKEFFSRGQQAAVLQQPAVDKEAFLEKSATSRQYKVLLQEGENEDPTGSAEGGGDEGGSGSDKSSSFLSAPSTLSFVVLAGLTATNL